MSTATAKSISNYFSGQKSKPSQATVSGPGIAPRIGRTSQTAASRIGTLQNWNPRRLNTAAEAREREAIALRAMDLNGDDPHVAGLIESMNINTVGTGFRPQSHIRHDVIPSLSGVDDKEITRLQRLAEWNFSVWSREADIQGTKHFNDHLLLADRTMLVRGEYLVLVRMPNRRTRRHCQYRLCLQAIDPLRLKTPSDKMRQDNIVDGVEIDVNGMPVAYWILKATARNGAHSSENFARIPARRGHRPQVLHGFIQKDPEQFRGYVFFAPAMKLFRDLSDHLDAELVSNIVTSAAALWVNAPDPTTTAMAAAGGADQFLQKYMEDSNRQYEEINPGAIYYGKPGEKPEVLSHNRPGSNFVPFIETILHAAASCGGVPYEVATRRYAGMNYSNARVALGDAWRVFKHRQDHESRHFCQPCWDMVMEESHLRGGFEVPDYYANRIAYNWCKWIPQAKGKIDPLKEIQAYILGYKYNMENLSSIFADAGKDWEEELRQRAKENSFAELLGLDIPTDIPSAVSKENAN